MLHEGRRTRGDSTTRVLCRRPVEPRRAAPSMGDDFYLRYYVGHKGKFGHEFLEFELRPDGRLRYANNSQYKNDTMIRKEVFCSPSVLAEVRRIVEESEVVREDDKNWPEPNRDGQHEDELGIYLC